MIVLDTNVVSEFMRPEPNENVLLWVDEQNSSDLYLTAITVAELLYGVARLPAGRRRNQLGGLVEETIREDFNRRVLSFDEIAAGHYGDLVSSRESAGRPISIADAQIVAICRSHEAVLATRNVSDFSEVGVVVANPWLR